MDVTSNRPRVGGAQEMAQHGFGECSLYTDNAQISQYLNMGIDGLVGRSY